MEMEERKSEKTDDQSYLFTVIEICFIVIFQISDSLLIYSFSQS